MSVCATAKSRRKAARQDRLGPKTGRDRGGARGTANLREIAVRQLGAAKRPAKMANRKK
jgi:hypothetical protein